MSEEKRPRTVTIFGAGVAGLTVAHELAERGFAVTVVDPAFREELPPQGIDRGIGGMARSQYAATHPLLGRPTDENQIRRAWSIDKFLCNDILRFDQETKKPVDPEYAENVIERVVDLLLELRKAAALTARADAWKSQLQIVIPGPDTNAWLGEAVKTAIARRLSDMKEPAELSDGIAITSLTVEEAVAQGISSEKLNGWAYFLVSRLDLFPGEHGFRFFPSFYRHLYDTMARTPLLTRRAHESAMSSTLDNLRPSDGLGFARAGKTKSFMVERRKIESMETARKYILLLLRELDYSLEDIQRVGIRLLEYMTSSTERRAKEYEDLSWGKFVRQELYSTVARKHIEYGPAMSAALRGSLSDARTQGNISVQLVMDQFRVDGRPDCLLNGPTTIAWLDHWHTYLCQQGVSFVRGKLEDFTVVGSKIEPKLRSGTLPTTDFYVLALSLPAAVSASEKMIERAGKLLPTDNDFAKTLAFGLTSRSRLDADVALAGPAGPLQHLSGIQYYFDVEMSFWRGHTQYLDSEWGLTSIAQPQFWGRRRDGSDAYRGILSVDIGIWDREYNGKSAWQCSPDEIAELAWAQIVDHHDDAFKERFGDEQHIPRPIAYAIDANLRFGGGGVEEDATPFLVNRTGAYRGRPGKVPDVTSGSKQISAYEVWNKQWVMAGTFLQTYTRLTSMEGANESGRHAANAILNVASAGGDRATIWDPEDCELPDLKFLRDVDAIRFREGKSHLVRALGVDSLVDSAPFPFG